jgi:hypothetical protein
MHATQASVRSGADVLLAAGCAELVAVGAAVAVAVKGFMLLVDAFVPASAAAASLTRCLAN